MRQYDRETTNPIIIEEELRFAKGTANVRPIHLIPNFVTGDWLIAPNGNEGYIAGRSDEIPGAWIFVLKTGPSPWDRTVMEMLESSFVGFTLKPKEMMK
jgi:hypothetical protein